MPAFHKHIGYRLDLSSINDVGQCLRLRDHARGIAEDEHFTDTVLRETFADLAVLAPTIRFDLVVNLSKSDCWSLWSLAQGVFQRTKITWRGGSCGRMPMAAEPQDQILVEALCRGEHLETSGIDVHGAPDRLHPLTRGHVDARLAAMESLGIRSAEADLPKVLEALLHSANAGEVNAPVRIAMYKFIMAFDRALVWDRVLDALDNEAPPVRSSIECSLWRLEGLLASRPSELAARTSA